MQFRGGSNSCAKQKVNLMLQRHYRNCRVHLLQEAHRGMFTKLFLTFLARTIIKSREPAISVLLSETIEQIFLGKTFENVFFFCAPQIGNHWQQRFSESMKSVGHVLKEQKLCPRYENL